MRRSRWLLAALVLTAAAPFLDVAPAAACSCVRATNRQHLRDADVVFVGEMTDDSGSDPDAIDAHFRFTVDEVFKGDVGAEIEIQAPTEGPACGPEFQAGVPYLVYAGEQSDDGRLHANSCNGTRRADGEPLPTSLRDGAPPADDIVVASLSNDDDADDAPFVVVVVAVGLAIGGAGIVLGRRPRRAS